MKLSLMTFPFIIDVMTKKMSVNGIYKLAKSHGVDHVDMMMIEIQRYGIHNIKSAFKENNMKLSCLISHIPFLSSSEDEIVALIDQSSSLAQEFGCSTVMIVPLALAMSLTDNPISLLEGQSKEELTYKLIKYFKIAVERASVQGIKICVEDTPSCKIPLSGIADCRKLLESVPGLGLVYDTANMIPAGDDSINFYKELKQYICHIHLKDIKYVEQSTDECVDGRYITACHWGEGIIPVNEIISLLNSEGYHLTAGIEYALTKPKSYNEHCDQLEEYLKYMKI